MLINYFVTIDYQKAAFTILQHLMERGHRRIAMISGMKTVLTTREHLKGYMFPGTRWGLER